MNIVSRQTTRNVKYPLKSYDPKYAGLMALTNAPTQQAQGSVANSLLDNPNPAPSPAPDAKHTSYLDAWNQFSLLRKDVPTELRSMGILDRAQADNQYYAERAGTDNQRRQFALGQMIGMLGGVMGGRLFGNTSAEQNVQNALPAINATQAMLQHTGAEDQQATVDHNTALNNFYNATFNLRKENDARDIHDQETGLGLYKAEEARKDVPALIGYEDVKGADGRMTRMMKFGTNGTVTHVQPIELSGNPSSGHSAANEIKENTAFLAIQKVVRDKEAAESDINTRRAAIYAKIEAASQPAKDEKTAQFNAQQIEKYRQQIAALDKERHDAIASAEGQVRQIQGSVGWKQQTGSADPVINITGKAGNAGGSSYLNTPKLKTSK